MTPYMAQLTALRSEAPECPLCGSASAPEPPFATADPACLYWRCSVAQGGCGWLHSTPGLTARALDELEPGLTSSPAPVHSLA
jgi:hypothetical protein